MNLLFWMNGITSQDCWKWQHKHKNNVKKIVLYSSTMAPQSLHQCTSHTVPNFFTYGNTEKNGEGFWIYWTSSLISKDIREINNQNQWREKKNQKIQHLDLESTENGQLPLSCASSRNEWTLSMSTDTKNPFANGKRSSNERHV